VFKFIKWTNINYTNKSKNKSKNKKKYHISGFNERCGSHINTTDIKSIEDIIQMDSLDRTVVNGIDNGTVK
jgi:hypothetical protein